jgi:glycosyltransferase 2 family protein
MSGWRDLMRKGWRSRSLRGALIGTLVIGGLSIYALYSLLRKDMPGINLEQLIDRIGIGMFLVAGLVYAGDLALAIIGWGWIVGTLGEIWDWPQHFRIYCITSVTRRLPGTMWYMLGRIVMYERLRVARSITAIAGGVEFATTILGGLLVAIITWPIALSGRQINPLWFVAGLLLGGLLLNPSILRALIRRVSPQSAPLDLRYRHLFGWMLLYAFVWCGGGGILYVLTNTIHPLPLTMLATLIGIWATSGLVSLLFSFIPFGLGIQELALSALLTPYVGGPEAIVIALLMRGVLTINEVLWAVIAGLLGLTGLVAAAQNKQIVTLPSVSAIGLSEAENPDELYESAAVIPPK